MIKWLISFLVVEVVWLLSLLTILLCELGENGR